MTSLLTCRLCLQDQDSSRCGLLRPENNESVLIIEMIKLCIPELKVDLQKHPAICKDCLGNVKHFYEFKIMCLNSTCHDDNLSDPEDLNQCNKILNVPSTINLNCDISSTNNKPDSTKRENPGENSSFKSIHIKDSTDFNTDINRNDISLKVITKSSKTTKRKKLPIYRTRFVSNGCFGCKNRILDATYHSEIYGSYYDCFICAKRFNSVSDIRKHVYLHILLHKCEICGKHWRDKYHLTLHLRTHTKEKLFECPVCGKKFVQSYTLHQHLSIHQKQSTKNKCTICSKVFSTKYNLKIHMTTHSNSGFSKPTCSKCHKWFYTNAALMKHSVICPLHLMKKEVIETESKSGARASLEFIKVEDVVKKEPTEKEEMRELVKQEPTEKEEMRYFI